MEKKFELMMKIELENCSCLKQYLKNESLKAHIESYVKDRAKSYEDEQYLFFYKLKVIVHDKFETFKEAHKNPDMDENTLGFFNAYRVERGGEVHLRKTPNMSDHIFVDLYHELEHVAQHIVNFHINNYVRYEFRLNELWARHISRLSFCQEFNSKLFLRLSKSMVKNDLDKLERIIEAGAYNDYEWGGFMRAKKLLKQLIKIFNTP